MGEYILVFYKLHNGFAHDKKILESSNSKNRLIYIAESTRYQEYKDKGYKYSVFKNVGDTYDEED